MEQKFPDQQYKMLITSNYYTRLQPAAILILQTLLTLRCKYKYIIQGQYTIRSIQQYSKLLLQQLKEHEKKNGKWQIVNNIWKL